MALAQQSNQPPRKIANAANTITPRQGLPLSRTAPMAIQTPQANTSNMIAAIIRRVDFMTNQLAKCFDPLPYPLARRAASCCRRRTYRPAGMAITSAVSRPLGFAHPGAKVTGERRKCFRQPAKR